MLKAYITILGRSTWALLNTYYAVLMEKAYFPDSVYIYAEEIYSEELKKAVEGIKILSEEFGFMPEIFTEIVSEADFINAGKEISQLVKRLKEEGHKIAIDITPGRKALVAAALIPAVKYRMDHVFYLSVKRLEAKPYMMIPLSIQELKDFAEVKNEQ
ncbi:hypothetical protein DRP07_05010 [Archaeoglobales archaeon]|nr:MAG: hypothetical protein DRP07_05010 [Archaeoglobales archaeon]